MRRSCRRVSPRRRLNLLCNHSFPSLTPIANANGTDAEPDRPPVSAARPSDRAGLPC